MKNVEDTLPTLVHWSNSSLYYFYPIYDLVHVDLVSTTDFKSGKSKEELKHVMSFVNCPQLLGIIFGKDSPLSLSATPIIEEHDHFNFLRTGTGSMIRWQEGLSDFQTLLILDKIKMISRQDKYFHLDLPLDGNCPKLPVEIRSKITDIRRTCRMTKRCLDVCEFPAELLAFWYMFGGEDDSKIQKSLMKMKQKKLTKTWSEFRETYSKFNQSMETLEAANLLFRPDIFDRVSEMIRTKKVHSELLTYVNPFDFVFSPRSEIVPPLSLDDIVDVFDEEYLSEIENRLATLLRLPEFSISNFDDFQQFAKIHNCEYMILPRDHVKILLAFEQSADVLSSFDIRFDSVRSLSLPVRRNFDCLADDVESLSKKGSRNIFVMMCWLAYKAPTMTLLSHPDFSRPRLYFSRYAPYDRTELVTSLIIRALKYFLLNPRNQCPLNGVFDECPDCALSCNRRKNKNKCYISKCPISVFLDGIRLRITTI